MTQPLDLEPAGRRMSRLVEAMPADALDRPTPCERYAVGDLLDHMHGAVLGFTVAATKRPEEGGPSADAAHLPDDWQARIPRDIAALIQAWRDPDAWSGMTRIAGVDLPGDMAGVVALDELVIHGWDLAKAMGMAAEYDGPGLDEVYGAVQQFSASGIEGLFGPPVPTPADAPLLDQILGLSGRNPGWEPPDRRGESVRNQRFRTEMRAGGSAADS